MLLGAISTTPFLDVLLAAGVTWAMHSSVAVVLLVMSLAARGVVPPEAAFALVLGANLGTAINPVLEGPAGDDPAAKRLPFGNLITRLVGVAWLLRRLIRSAVSWWRFNRTMRGRSLNSTLSSTWCWSQPIYLDPAAKETPIVALGAAAREALRLADVLGDMLAGARDALTKGDRKVISETRRRDNILDRLNTAIQSYLTSLDPDELNEADHRRLNEIMTFSMHLEQAGDVVDRSMLPHAAKRLRRGLAFSKQGQADLIAMLDRLAANLRTAASLSLTEDPRTARLLACEKVAFREAESKATMAHFERLRTTRRRRADERASPRPSARHEACQ
jgi:phosphate:Na+ symporter